MCAPQKINLQCSACSIVNVSLVINLFHIYSTKSTFVWLVPLKSTVKDYVPCMLCLYSVTKCIYHAVVHVHVHSCLKFVCYINSLIEDILHLWEFPTFETMKQKICINTRLL